MDITRYLKIVIKLQANSLSWTLKLPAGYIKRPGYGSRCLGIRLSGDPRRCVTVRGGSRDNPGMSGHTRKYLFGLVCLIRIVLPVSRLVVEVTGDTGSFHPLTCFVRNRPSLLVFEN